MERVDVLGTSWQNWSSLLEWKHWGSGGTLPWGEGSLADVVVTVGSALFFLYEPTWSPSSAELDQARLPPSGHWDPSGGS